MTIPTFFTSSRRAIAAALAAVVLIGFGAWYLSSPRQEPVVTWQPTVVSTLLPYTVTLNAPTFPVVGEATPVTLTVKNDGQLDDLLARVVLPHVTVASHNGADMWFYHAGNDLLEVKPGVYSFTHTFTQAGPYTLWIELNDNTSRDHHGAASDYSGRVDLTLGVDSGEEAAPSSQAATSGPYTLKVEPSGSAVAGQPVRLTFSALDQSGRPVELITNIDHYFAVTGVDHYELWHPDAAASNTTQVTTAPLTFPHPGTYNVFVRLFSNKGTVDSPTLGAEMAGTFVLKVK